MKAMLLTSIASMDANPEPLTLTEVPKPAPGGHQVLIRIAACGVCHTELDEIEGRTPPPRLPVVPGHQVAGRVESLGPNASRFRVGDRVGVGWIYHSSGGDDENISEQFRATGRDANGGYAEFMVVHERYAHPLPDADALSDVEAAPLLCAGSVGYRALKLANVRDGDVLGLMGFGGSNHLVLQVARFLYPTSKLFVFARSAREREFAVQLGAAWAGDIGEKPPEPQHAVIDTTPVWRPVLASLKSLRPGGRLVINAIRKEDRDKHLMAEIDYAEHLWMEKEIKSVANVTARDIEEFLQVAARAGIKPTVQTYPLEDANRALRDLRTGDVRGAKVLVINPPQP